jgi:hypothetical protein
MGRQSFPQILVNHLPHWQKQSRAEGPGFFALFGETMQWPAGAFRFLLARQYETALPHPSRQLKSLFPQTNESSRHARCVFLLKIKAQIGKLSRRTKAEAKACISEMRMAGAAARSTVMNVD